MQIIVNTSGSVTATNQVPDDIEAVVETALARFSARLTGVEVHPSDSGSHSQSAGT